MILARLTALVLGLLAGAMLTILVVLVPFWTAAPPAEFRAWFAANAPRIRALMVPLGVAGGLGVIATVVATRGARAWPLAAAACALGVIAITVLVNEPANARFVDPSALAEREVPALLAHWVRWHRVRVVLGVAGFYASLRALGRR